MKYRQLGASGPRISAITFGAWPIGGGLGTVERQTAIATVRHALDVGVNAIDTAELYRDSESILGDALTGYPRERVFLATKVSVEPFTRARVREALENSLRALRTDYIDLYQLHRYPTGVPLHEALDAMVEVVREGRARYIGTSMFTAPSSRSVLAVRFNRSSRASTSFTPKRRATRFPTATTTASASSSTAPSAKDFSPVAIARVTNLRQTTNGAPWNDFRARRSPPISPGPTSLPRSLGKRASRSFSLPLPGPWQHRGSPPRSSAPRARSRSTSTSARWTCGSAPTISAGLTPSPGSRSDSHNSFMSGPRVHLAFRLLCVHVSMRFRSRRAAGLRSPRELDCALQHSRRGRPRHRPLRRRVRLRPVAVGNGVGVAPPQPIQFSHKHHVVDDGIDCRYCHTSVETSSFSRACPDSKTCMNCHQQILAQSPLLARVRESWATGTPIVWARVNRLPDYAYFDHSIHVQKGVGCSSCHGQVDQMPLTTKAESLQMSFCLNCHMAPQNQLRPQSQIFNFEWSPPADQAALGKGSCRSTTSRAR